MVLEYGRSLARVGSKDVRALREDRKGQMGMGVVEDPMTRGTRGGRICSRRWEKVKWIQILETERASGLADRNLGGAYLLLSTMGLLPGEAVAGMWPSHRGKGMGSKPHGVGRKKTGR